MDWEKIFANNVTDKDLILKIYKQLKNKTKNGQKSLNRYSSKRIYIVILYIYISIYNKYI